MKAFVSDRYGGPEVLGLRETAKPVPGENEVLIKVHALALNPADWHFLRGSPFMIRFGSGLFTPKTKILGADLAGVVETAGSAVTKFKPGDEVYADASGDGFGAYAEYVTLPETTPATKPTVLTYIEAAAVPLAGVTALQALRDHGKLQAGEKALINGASGGVGHFAVQIAKAMGAEVTGVCSGRNVDFVTGLGADHVIDYTAEDLTKSGRKFDVVIDAVGNLGLGARRMLTPNGRAVMVGFGSMGGVIGAAVLGGSKVKAIMSKANATDLAALTKMIEDGKVKPVLDETYPFADLPAAITYLETGRARGKIVVEINRA